MVRIPFIVLHKEPRFFHPPPHNESHRSIRIKRAKTRISEDGVLLWGRLVMMISSWFLTSSRRGYRAELIPLHRTIFQSAGRLTGGCICDVDIAAALSTFYQRSLTYKSSRASETQLCEALREIRSTLKCGSTHSSWNPSAL